MKSDEAILPFEMAHTFGIDLGQAMPDKVERDESRYPQETARRTHAKYCEL